MEDETEELCEELHTELDWIDPNWGRPNWSDQRLGSGYDKYADRRDWPYDD